MGRSDAGGGRTRREASWGDVGAGRGWGPGGALAGEPGVRWVIRGGGADVGSRLGDWVREAARELTGSGEGARVVLVSDGRVTGGLGAGRGRSGGRLAGQAVRGLRVGVSAAVVGSSEEERGLGVQAWAEPGWLGIGERGRLMVEVEQAGLGVTESVELTVRGPGLGGAERDGVWRGRMGFGGGSRAVVEVPVTGVREDGAKPEGLAAWRVEVTPVAGEREVEDNGVWVVAGVGERALRVLLVEARPGWTGRLLAGALRTDRGVRLTRVSRVSGGVEGSAGERVVVSGGWDEGAGGVEPDALRPGGSTGGLDWDGLLSGAEVVVLGPGAWEWLSGVGLADAVLRDRLGSRGVVWVPGSGARGEGAGVGGVSVGLELTPGGAGVAWLEGLDQGRAVRMAGSGAVTRDGAGLESVLRGWPGWGSGPNAGLGWRTLVRGRAAKGSGATGVVWLREAGATGSAGRAGGAGGAVVLGEGWWRWRADEREAGLRGPGFDRFWRGLVRAVAGHGLAEDDGEGRVGVGVRVEQRWVEEGGRVGFEAWGLADSAALMVDRWEGAGPLQWGTDRGWVLAPVGEARVELTARVGGEGDGVSGTVRLGRRGVYRLRVAGGAGSGGVITVGGVGRGAGEGLRVATDRQWLEGLVAGGVETGAAEVGLDRVWAVDEAEAFAAALRAERGGYEGGRSQRAVRGAWPVLDRWWGDWGWAGGGVGWWLGLGVALLLLGLDWRLGLRVDTPKGGAG